MSVVHFKAIADVLHCLDQVNKYFKQHLIKKPTSGTNCQIFSRFSLL